LLGQLLNAFGERFIFVIHLFCDGNYLLGSILILYFHEGYLLTCSHIDSGQIVLTISAAHVHTAF
jgi:hypothetical protein